MHADAPFLIRPFQTSDESEIVSLWQRCGLLVPQNDPHKDIQRKLREEPELFLVGVVDSTVVATVMAGYDGHRGWLYYLAVAPECQRRNYGRRLVEHAETLLRERGCPKINLCVRSSNQSVIAFYERLGFACEPVVVMGKRLVVDQPFSNK
jgi:ribosomal protein S18 acetylase RimI-like enzyme